MSDTTRTASDSIDPGYYIATKNGQLTLVGQKLTKEEALHLCGMGVDNAFSCTAYIEYVDDLLWRGWVFTKLIPETELTSARADIERLKNEIMMTWEEARHENGIMWRYSRAKLVMEGKE